MGRRVLITGGAGFIGSHLTDELLASGYGVRLVDNLSEQVHGPRSRWPSYLDPRAERVRGDVRDPAAVRRALEGVDAVFHLAASVGVGQSMYQIEQYVSDNDLGTAVLLQALTERPVERLVVASSMSVYGEGQYRDHRGEPRAPRARQLDQLRRQEWELCCDGDLIEPVPTPESKQPVPTSVYALNKYVQERLCLLVGEAYGIPTVALRFFNVYGPRQALANPYTGVLAIFSARLLNGKPPRIFEDGLQQRDFVSVHDVKRACRLALETPGGRGEAINIGSGCAVTVREVARRVGTVLGREHLVAQTTSEYRAGDIRHCFADIQRAKQVLGYEPQVDLREGLAELAAWLGEQLAPDRSEDAVQELARRGLTVGAAPRAGDRLA